MEGKDKERKGNPSKINEGNKGKKGKTKRMEGKG